MKKWPFSIQCRDLNSRPLEHDSPPITTRPSWLPPTLSIFSLSSVHSTADYAA